MKFIKSNLKIILFLLVIIIVITLFNMFINRANDALTLRNSQIEKDRANKLALENYENTLSVYTDRAAA